MTLFFLQLAIYNVQFISISFFEHLWSEYIIDNWVHSENWWIA